MGLKEIIKDSEIKDLVNHSIGYILTMGMTNQICKYIDGKEGLSEEKKKLYTNALRGATASGNASYYLGEKFFGTNKDYTLFAKTVFTGVASVAGAAFMASLSKYAPKHAKPVEKEADKK
jgi:hypothetical protein